MSWKSLIDPISTLLDKFIPDADKRNDLAHKINTMAERNAHEIAKGQREVNKHEAAQKSMFVAGWRPAAGWACVTGMAFNFIILPLLNFTMLILNVTATAEGVETVVQLPSLSLSEMMPVLLGMLGLGSARSYEKKNKVAREK